MHGESTLANPKASLAIVFADINLLFMCKMKLELQYEPQFLVLSVKWLSRFYATRKKCTFLKYFCLDVVSMLFLIFLVIWKDFGEMVRININHRFPWFFFCFFICLMFLNKTIMVLLQFYERASWWRGGTTCKGGGLNFENFENIYIYFNVFKI